jgi:hypothetical protein
MALDFEILAKDIEDQLAKRKGPLPDMGKADRDMLFSAIAEAVVEHLHTHGVVEVSDPRLDQQPAIGVIK